ncbi:helix-turn-helix domain-containing protein [Chitinophagaceae bacterium MMS25-I14]
MRTTDMHEVHEGRNVKRLREILGIKQDALAIDLGITQQAVSLLEQKETIDAPVLEKIAKSLGVSVEAIRNYNEEAIFNNIQNNSDTSSNNTIINIQNNPLEKIIELYERLLQSEKEKVALMEKMMGK